MTMMSAILLFAAPDRLDKTEQENFTAQLQAHGFNAFVCENLSTVYELMQRGIAPAGAGPTLKVRAVVLGGLAGDNRTAAACLRMLYPQLAIMAMMSGHDHAEAIQALQSGVDSVFAADTPGSLRMAMLMALMRSRQIAPVAVEAPEQKLPAALDEAPWVLRDKGWALTNPSGVGVALTTAERAFMQALLGAPDRQATRSELLRAIGGDEAPSVGPGANRRLGVVVSRMRRKFQEHGLELPLQAVHGAGYMFTAALE